jgi:hypothetical protein
MADTKISALTSATLPLAGTEVLPIVQSGVTVKVPVDSLTVQNIRSNATNGILQVTGPAAASTRVMTVPNVSFTAARTDAAQSFTGDQTLSTGNLVIGTSGKGIDFSATPGTGTSELLDDYEEGTWTPVLSSDGTEPTSVVGTFVGTYVKVGRMVTAWGTASFTTYSDGTGVGRLGGLPFTCSTTATGRSALGTEQCVFAAGYTTTNILAANGTAYAIPRQCGSARDDSGVTLSTFSPSSATTKYWVFTLQYETNS